MENKIDISQRNREQQLQFIRKMENELINQGYGSGALTALRNKYSPSEMHTGYSKNSKVENKEYVEDRTQETYKLYLNEIKLYQKLDRDHNHQLHNLLKEKDDAEVINIKSRNKLLETEHQI